MMFKGLAVVLCTLRFQANLEGIDRSRFDFFKKNMYDEFFFFDLQIFFPLIFGGCCPSNSKQLARVKLQCHEVM